MEERRFTTSWGDIEYLVHGSGPSLIFLHGGFATAHAYIPLFERLGRHFSIVAPTHPGHGDSFPVSKTWRFEDFVSAYQSFFTSLAIASPILVGHSFGGALALFLAHRGLGIKVIGLDPVGIPFRFTTRAYTQAKKKEAQALLAYGKDRKRVMQTLSAAGTLLYTARRHPKNVMWLARQAPLLDIRKELLEITQPVRLFWGEDDGIVPQAVGDEMAAIIPDCQIKIFPNKGHTYPVTDPDFTYDELALAILGRPWC